MSKLYTCQVVEKIISQYAETGNAEIYEVEEGSLGYGLIVITGENLKTCIIQEVYLNAWSSGHKIRFYNEIPKKYQKMIDDMIDENYDYCM